MCLNNIARIIMSIKYMAYGKHEIQGGFYEETITIWYITINLLS